MENLNDELVQSYINAEVEKRLDAARKPEGSMYVVLWVAFLICGLLFAGSFVSGRYTAFKDMNPCTTYYGKTYCVRQ